jgi:hypothetical protein
MRWCNVTIYKYPIKHNESFFVDIPEDAKFLTMKHKGGPYMWWLVDETTRKVARCFRVVGTGWDLPQDAKTWKYLGIWIDDGIVWHLFEVV